MKKNQESGLSVARSLSIIRHPSIDHRPSPITVGGSGFCDTMRVVPYLLLASSQAWTIQRACRLTTHLHADSEIPSYPQPRNYDPALLGDLTGGRPGAIIETEEQLEIKERMLSEKRDYPDWFDQYGELQDDVEAEYDTDDPTAIDSATLGTWTIQDLKSKFDYEWDPNSDEPDPNLYELSHDGVRYLPENEKDDDGVEVGYNPIFGPSNPIDTRTVLGSKDSYMVDEATRDTLTPQFWPDDPEIGFNDEIVQFRKSLDIMETYIDPFLPMPVPRHAAKWHGYPEPMYFEPKNYTNNRFTDSPTDFDSMTPHRARTTAVEYARAKNAEWLPEQVSFDFHADQRAPYDEYGTLVGTLKPGEVDPEIKEQIQPALNILGSCAQLLSIDGSVFRFHYHGLMKNKFGMKCWTESMLKDCGVNVTGVIFETGFRRRDPAYDGGDPWNGPVL